MKAIYKTFSITVLSALCIGCEDLKFGNDFLDKPLSDDMAVEDVFSSKQYADQALNMFYKSLPDYLPALRGYHSQGLILDTYSDLAYTQYLSWRQGSITPSSGVQNFPFYLWNDEHTGDPTFGIRKAYIYLENVDRVPDMSPKEKKTRKAEAKVVIASHYINMIRFYGGVPWIDGSYAAEEVASAFTMPRMTLEETVNRTVALLDEAAVDLPWYTTTAEYGHMTAAVAKALKFRLLHFVASPLFNNDEPYLAGQAATDKLVWYGDYKQERWEAALKAGQEFLQMNSNNGNYYRIENTGNPREDYLNAYFTKGNQEVIMASFRFPTYEDVKKSFRMYEGGYGMPRSSYADLFEWKDGSKFDWNNPTHRANPFFEGTGSNKVITRDARLYETLVVNGDDWQNRSAEVYVGGREGPGPNTTLGQRTLYGYGFRKFVRDCVNGSKKNQVKGKPYSCPLIRLPEIYLGVAEVMNQLGMATQKDELGYDAYDYLNFVHERAGLPPVTPEKVSPGEDLLNYLLDERAREFGQEDVRYYDIIRYKKANDWVTRPVDVLTITKEGNDFKYEHSVREDLKYLWKDEWYLLPFPTSEINKKYGLIQNPGWE